MLQYLGFRFKPWYRAPPPLIAFRRNYAKEYPPNRPVQGLKDVSLADEPWARDPRPQWVYKTSHFLTFSVIPFVLFYAVFFFDFGEKEHVFSPVRRWAASQKSSFFSLTSAEKELIEVDSANRDISLPSQAASHSDSELGKS